MWTPSLCALLAVLPLAAAQTWPGFVPQIPQTLDLEFAGHNVSRGELFEDLEDVRFQPRVRILLSDPAISTEGSWLVIMFDSDVPVNGSRTTYLHWIANAEKAEIGAENLVLPASKGEVTYTPPRPQAGDSLHRYSVLMYERPANFSLARAMPNTDWDSYRMGFDMEDFLRETGLTLALGATYFRVAEPLPSNEQMPEFPPPAYTMGPKVDGPEGWWSESAGVALRVGYRGVMLVVAAALLLAY